MIAVAFTLDGTCRTVELTRVPVPGEFIATHRGPIRVGTVLHTPSELTAATLGVDAFEPPAQPQPPTEMSAEPEQIVVRRAVTRSRTRLMQAMASLLRALLSLPPADRAELARLLLEVRR